MENNKILKTFNTTIPMPIYQYPVNITYNEVKKASGIAYILLDLILKENDSYEEISKLLLKFGIPKDLLYIFGDTLANLIETKIIASDYSSSCFSKMSEFEVIKINEVWLTPKGKKLFKDGAIPTGEEKVKEAKIFYSPVTRQYDRKCNSPIAPFSSSVLTLSFLDNVKVDISGMPDYVESVKKELGLKGEESIVKQDIGDPEKFQIRKEKGLKINLMKDSVTFELPSNDELEFFNSYYNTDNLETLIAAKNSYRFRLIDSNGLLKIGSNSLTEEEHLLLPTEVVDDTNNKAVFYIGKGLMGETGQKSEYKLNSENDLELIKLIDDRIECILVDNAGAFAYIPANIEFNATQIPGALHLNMAIRRRLSVDSENKLLNALFDKYLKMDYSYESSNAVLYLFKKLGDTYVRRYIEFKLNQKETVDYKITSLMDMNKELKEYSGWNELFKEIATELYSASTKEIVIDNMIYKRKMLTPLKERLNISDNDFINVFIEAVKAEDNEIIYQALDTAEFNTVEILKHVNVIKSYASNVLHNAEFEYESELSDKFNNLRNNLWRINELAGIKRVDDYVINDDINIDLFLKLYATVVENYNSLKEYKSFASEEYSILDRYINILSPIQELLALEKIAMDDPSKINEKSIDSSIMKGKYKEAIVNLHIKLQFILIEKLKLNPDVKAYDKIEKAIATKLVSKKEGAELHRLRECRNCFEHPEKGKYEFTKDDIEAWKKLVFKVGEVK